jgi:hypothetical protein
MPTLAVGLIPVIIGITGKAQSGKDTFADMLAHVTNSGRYAFAKPLKQMLKSGLDLDDKDDARALALYGKNYRVLAQTLGTEWGRSIHPEMWLNIAKMRMAVRKEASIIISDVRFDNEAAWVRENGVLIHVERSFQQLIKESDHASEQGIFPKDGDFLVSNSRDLAYLFDRATKIGNELAARFNLPKNHFPIYPQGEQDREEGKN